MPNDNTAAQAAIKLLGMEMTVTMAQRIIAAVRGTYPDLTADETSDVRAVARVVRFWLTETLANFEASTVSSDGVEVVEATRREVEEWARAARDKAREDALHDIIPTEA